ncbi:MAG: hypothetical protein PHC38_05555 [Weeksellaceae bacterium]|jgi:hypothetical protein|nr:hypothetical protein [Weeksellaceae bacterium]
MRKLLLLCVATLMLTSCGVKVNSVNLKQRTYDDLPLNTQITKDIGDQVILKGLEEYQDAVIITNREPSMRIYTVDFSYPIGTVLPLSGEVEKYKLYYNKSDKILSNGGYYYVGVAVEKSTNSPKVFYVLEGAMGGIYTKDYNTLEVQPAIYNDPSCQRCFKQEFIYNGRVDSHLKFIYREYVNDMARPAFNQELQYDLNESDIIGFKGARLQVIKATNTAITYKIINSFN